MVQLTDLGSEDKTQRRELKRQGLVLFGNCNDLIGTDGTAEGVGVHRFTHLSPKDPGQCQAPNRNTARTTAHNYSRKRIAGTVLSATA